MAKVNHVFETGYNPVFDDEFVYDRMAVALDELLENMALVSKTDAIVINGKVTYKHIDSTKIVASDIKAADLLKLISSSNMKIGVYDCDDHVRVSTTDHDYSTTWVIKPFANPKHGEVVVISTYDFENQRDSVAVIGEVVDTVDYLNDNKWCLGVSLNDEYEHNGHFDNEGSCIGLTVVPSFNDTLRIWVA